MIDINLIREQPDKVKENAANKGVTIDIDQVVKLDAERRKLQTELDVIRSEKNKLGREINKLTPEERDAKIAALRAQDVKADSLEDEYKRVDAELETLLWQIPNMADADVPVGKDESGNVVVKKVGEPTEFSFQFSDYMGLASEMDIIDTERAAKVSGSRFGYIKGAAAMLEFALVQYAFNTLTNPEIIAKIAASVDPEISTTPFVPVVPPVLVREEPFRKMARLNADTYDLPNDELYLVASAEHSMGPMHMDEIFGDTELPRRYIGFSTAFRREAGTYGKDTKGILRVHQFDKVEMEIFTKPELARKEFDFAVACQEYLVSSLNLPYQLLFKCTGDIGLPNARGMDIEVWMPGENKYRETHTADYMADYQSRRLNTRFRRPDGSVEFVHMIDATGFAIGRMLIAIIENNQQEDGSIKVPEALKPYLPFEVISGPFGMGM